MSLNQKYTWNDFLNEHPELKQKKVKRTSAEGKKAFEAAYKARIKDLLRDRLGWIEKEEARVNKKKDALVGEIKAVKKILIKRKLQSNIGAKDKYLHRLEKLAIKTKQVQKSI